MPVDLSDALPLVWSPTGHVDTNLANNPSFETAVGSVEVRRNLAYDPRAVHTPLDGKFMFSSRWFGGAASGTVTVGVAGVGPTGGPSTFIRKQWTAITDPNSIQDVGFTLATGNGTAAVPVTPGDVFMVSFWFRTSWQGGGPNNSINATFYDAAGAVLPSAGAHFVGPNNPFPAPNVWLRISQAITVPPTAAFMQVWHDFYTNVSPPPVGGILDVTGLLAEKSPVLGSYFDGGNPGTVARRNAFPEPNLPPGGAWGAILPGAGAITNETASPHTPGLNYLRETVTTPAPGNARIDGYQHISTIGVTTFSVWVRASAAFDFTLNVVANGPGGAYDLAQSPQVLLAANVWTRISMTFTVPGDVTYMTFRYIWLGAGNTLGFKGDLSEILVENSATAGEWFDGGHPISPYKSAWIGTPEFTPSYLYSDDFTPSWTGTADASASILTAQQVAEAGAVNCYSVFSGVWFLAGDHSLRLIPSGSTPDSFAPIGGDIGGMRLGMQAGKTYTVMATSHLAAPQTGAVAGIARGILIYTRIGSGSYVPIESDHPPNTAGDHPLRVTFDIPVGATEAFIRLYNGASKGNGDVWWDNFALVEGVYAGPYFDGDMSSDSGPGYVYDWVGDENASPSTRTALVSSPADPNDYLFPANTPQPDGDLFTHRTTKVIYELLTTDDAPAAILGTASDDAGTLTFDVSGRIKGGGSIEVADDGTVIDWIHTRIRITRLVNGVAWRRGIWLPTFPGAHWRGGRRYWTIELHDKLTVLDQDCITEALVYPEGTVVTTAVREQIEAAGEDSHNITEGPATLANDMMWEAGTPRLTICNNMLDASGYFTLRMDNEGQYVAEPYVPPSQRPPAFYFQDGVNCTYLDDFDTSQDIFFVPNRVLAIQEGDDETEGMVGLAENTNPDNPYSFPAVGRWITDVQTGVEATDQEALDAYAHARLVDLSNPGATVLIEAAPDPRIELYKAVVFSHHDRTPHSDPGDYADILDLFVIDRIDESLTTGGLMKLTLRAVLGFTPDEASTMMFP